MSCTTVGFGPACRALVLCLTLTGPIARAETGVLHLTALGGPSLPRGDFADVMQGGYQLGGAVEYRLSDNWSVGMDVIWNRHDGRQIAGSDSVALPAAVRDGVTNLQIGVRTRNYPFTKGALSRFYVLWGVGIYNFSGASATHTIVLRRDSLGVEYMQIHEPPHGSGQLGSKIGLGADFAVSRWACLGLEVEHNLLRHGGSYLGIHGGMTVALWRRCEPK